MQLSKITTLRIALRKINLRLLNTPVPQFSFCCIHPLAIIIAFKPRLLPSITKLFYKKIHTRHKEKQERQTEQYSSFMYVDTYGISTYTVS